MSSRNFFDTYAKGQQSTGLTSSIARVENTQSDFEGRKSEVQG